MAGNCAFLDESHLSSRNSILTQSPTFSGGFMGDLVFNGGEDLHFRDVFAAERNVLGKFGIWVGNQQCATHPSSHFSRDLSSACQIYSKEHHSQQCADVYICPLELVRVIKTLEVYEISTT